MSTQMANLGDVEDYEQFLDELDKVWGGMLSGYWFRIAAFAALWVTFAFLARRQGGITSCRCTPTSK